MTIYELTQDFLRLKEMAEDPDIDEQALADTMEGIEGEIEIKADGYAKVIKELEATSAGLDSEAKRLASKKKLIDNSISRIKKNLENAMIATGKVKFKTNLFSFNIQKNPAALKLAEDIDFNSIPAEYIKFADPEIDKAKVKDAIKNGQQFTWAHLEQSEGLRIK